MNAAMQPASARPPLAAAADLGLTLAPRYRTLSPGFYTQVLPQPAGPSPVCLHVSPAAASLIGLDRARLDDPAFARCFAEVFAGMRPIAGAAPLAMVYSGHQFGVWAGQLGDGRALTIAEVQGAEAQIWDIQLKGAGRTPYSRFGDGRAVLRSSIREYLASEAMAALGVPTTRALCLVGTGAAVARERIEPGAVVTRLLRSNIRFGHFEHVHHGGQPERVRELADFVIDQHVPALAAEADRYGLWFDAVVAATARMIAHWQSLGFCHGVMNTDNMSILGDTIDYGPFGFLDGFDPGHVCNHSDHSGRYAFDQQPGIGLWNLKALAVALSSLLPWERAVVALQSYGPCFSEHLAHLMAAKLGLSTHQGQPDPATVTALATEFLALMQAANADYTLSFRLLSGTAEQAGRERWSALFEGETRGAAIAWLERWQALMAAQPDHTQRLAAMDRANPAFVLRNWVAETAIRAVEDDGDVAMLDRIYRLVTQPFDAHTAADQFLATGPVGRMAGLEVSCSS